jgi:RNA-directed DNA polymerase
MEFMWHSTPWDSVWKRVNKLQSRIAKATSEGKRNLAKKLQYLLIHSFSAKLLAVKQVTSNRGKNTSGIDGKVWRTPASKFKAALSLSTKNYKAMRLKRVYIEKKGKKKKRPLGIPTMYDRAIQALCAMALDPIAETTADTPSFGFRKHRGTRDAEAHINRYLFHKTSAQWILEGDIKGCFDNINHSWLMNHIPMDKRILKQFLKAGYVYKKKLFPTEKGSPQGGIMTPLTQLATLSLKYL